MKMQLSKNQFQSACPNNKNDRQVNPKIQDSPKADKKGAHGNNIGSLQTLSLGKFEIFEKKNLKEDKKWLCNPNYDFRKNRLEILAWGFKKFDFPKNKV